MTLKRIVVVAAALMTSALPMRAQGVRKLDISFNAGKVTIVAENVTLAEILGEWSRKGGSKIVNAERLPGTPVMFTEFKDQPEADVLRTLLREAPGYGAAMRATPPAGASAVQTVFILAVRRESATASPATTTSTPVQQQSSPVAAPRMIQGSPDDEIPPVRPLTPEMNPGNPSTPANGPGGPAGQPANNPNLRVGPGGTVTSMVPGVVIPGPPATPANAPKPNGRGGGGGSR
jgi:hypothetical protein